ncbi:DgyrCDS10128 [Dimorphilus gyrociliatus]|uniref:[acyl-carrier-protein] S-malonyltransferase n=1 Tax=Dimorphilus gyrociliatus TaxID=2664684 RepID=A0A7I8W0E6_9ANNE|nr:DgyrCDS10128 [Dimorphilus gyrociliatus]
MILRNIKKLHKNTSYMKCIASRCLNQKTTDNNEFVNKDLSEYLSNDPPERPIDPEFPSDYEEYRMQEWLKYNKIKRSQEKKVKRPLIDPRDTSIILFPGQGAQFVGMGRETLNFPNVRNMFEAASTRMGKDLLKLCLDGPIEELNKTENCQPAVFLCSLAAVEKLKNLEPYAIEKCIATAGFSLGEITALVFSGAFSFETGLQVVINRAKAMQKASEIIPSGLARVFLKSNSKLGFACKTARDYCKDKLKIENPVCGVANYLFPECKVIGGNIEALQFIKDNRREFKLLGVQMLHVSGAFHTELMSSAQEDFKNTLNHVKIDKPIVHTYSNIEVSPYKKVNDIKKLLVKQLVKPVKWEQIMHTIYTRDKTEEFPDTFELGPGKQLGSILKSTNRRAFSYYKSINI